MEPNQPGKAGGEDALEAGNGQALRDLSSDIPPSFQGHHYTAPLREVLLLQRVEEVTVEAGLSLQPVLLAQRRLERIHRSSKLEQS